MSIKTRIAGVFLAACMLFGCSSSESSGAASSGTADSGPAAVSSDPSSRIPEAPADEKPGVLPVISIQTKSTADNAMDFVTKPVNGHVSQSIASWTPGYVKPPEPYYEDCCISVFGTDGKPVMSNADAQVKVRGNWTSSYDKKSLRVKFAEKQPMLGLNDGKDFKNWVLLAEYKDASMLRNKTSLEAARGILDPDGLYASDSRLVEVKINGSYYGVYLLAEYQQINKGRVEITKAEENYQGTDIGYLLEMDGNYLSEDVQQRFFVGYHDNAELVPYDGNGGSGKTITCLGGNKTKIGFTIKSDIYSKDQRDFIKGFVDGVYNIMYEAAYNNKAFVFNSDFSDISETDTITPREAVERVVDVESLADAYLVAELTCDADIYISSFYMSADFGPGGEKKLRFEAPWDFDSGLGNKDRCADGTGFYAANIVPEVNGYAYYTVNPWLAVLMYQDWYQDIIREKWTRAYDASFLKETAEKIITDSKELKDAFDRNYLKWDNIGRDQPFFGELSRQAAACRNQQQAADFLFKWFTARIDFINANWHK